jgi:DNA-binding NtrC family response regulator
MSLFAPYPDTRLLIVDDDRQLRAIAMRAASSWNYLVDDCDSAEAALERLKTEHYNIILSDISMGRMDGITFARKVTAIMPSVAIIIMTGKPNPKTARESQDLGAIYYLPKPLEHKELGETLRIASAWNIGMLTDKAARRFLMMRKGGERDAENRLKSVKAAIRKALQIPTMARHLRDFAYGQSADGNPVYNELTFRFSTNSVKHF